MITVIKAIKSGPMICIVSRKAKKLRNLKGFRTKIQFNLTVLLVVNHVKYNTMDEQEVDSSSNKLSFRKYEHYEANVDRSH